MTTLRLGGPADLLAEPCNVDGLQTLLRESSRLELPVTLIGQGSDLLVRDGGIRGLVIRLAGRFRGMTVTGQRMTVLAGTSMSAAANEAAANDLAGLAFASGIPGTVGGAAYMNAGAYGGEKKDVITHVTACLPDGRTVAYSNEEMDFGYRKSKINQQPEPIAITSVTVALTPADEETVRATMREFSARRREKQPLTLPSCGSTFKRPEGRFAGTLIEECGLKGCRVGGCSVSTLHAGFLVNDQQGSACDYLSLIAQVQKTVYEKTGVRLEPEVRIWGEDVCAKEI